ncbi:hypothetical protein HYU82_02460 [Candidatus Saccharibacteria bacterium]|nr:hypothetical protein [Candidatus Saccharibacteria bacterium]
MERKEGLVSLRTRIAVLTTLVISSLGLVSAALADPATPNQSSCSADGNVGSGNIVWKDGQLVVSTCHTGDSSFDTTIPVQSGNCHGAINSQNENIVCVKQ